MLRTAFLLLLTCYLPGALLFRLPFARADLRSRLSADERGFWGLMLSVAITSIIAFVLAFVGAYRLERLVLLNVAVCLALVTIGRRQLRLPADAPGINRSALIPLVLAGLAVSVFFHVPPAEYVIGGRDPGVYINEGIQIAQRGGISVRDPLVASIPAEFRSLFFRPRTPEVTDRFLAFFIVDFEEGRVVGQFPHLYPLWVAVAYGIDGLTGARYVVGWLAGLGILSVYFCGMWLVGRPAAAVGAALLTLNVAEVWYSRYPNSEVLVQSLVFAGLLAYGRATIDKDRFFLPIAAVLFALSLFAHLSSILVAAGLGVAVVLGLVDRRRLEWWFIVPFTVGLALAAWYFDSTLQGYLTIPRYILSRAGPVHIVALGVGAGALIAVLALLRRPAVRAAIHRRLPWISLVALMGALAYAYFLRQPVGRLAPHDAHAARDFTHVYLSRTGLLAALAGLVLMVRASFWRNLAFLTATVAFTGFVFYKIRIVPEHFWLARRYLPVILPSACLLIGVSVCAPLMGASATPGRRARRALLLLPGLAVVGIVATHFVSTAAAISKHVEYAGVIPHLEELDTRINDDDLLLVESRQRSDLHVLAVPLAYIYANQVLVLAPSSPDPVALSRFLAWARPRHGRVLFAGEGGTRVISRFTSATHIATDRFQVPEYARTYPEIPHETRLKQFNVGLYELVPRSPTEEPFDLDVGTEDNLYVLGFYGPEAPDRGPSFRWSRDRSSILVPRVRSDASTVTVWLSAGGRPLTPLVTVALGKRLLGSVVVGEGFRPYTFPIEPDHAAELSAEEDVIDMDITTDTWTPATVTGGGDNRALGVMVDRVRID